MNKQNVIYLPVSVAERLPKNADFYLVIDKTDEQWDYFFNGENWLNENDEIASDVTHWLEPITDQYLFTYDQLAEYLANYSFHMSGAYNKNNAEKYIEGDWRNYKQETENK